MISNDELEILLDSLWDDDSSDIVPLDGSISSFPSAATAPSESSTTSNPMSSNPAAPTATKSTLQLLEEKLMSLASGSDDMVKNDEHVLMGDVQKADRADLDAILANEMNRLSMQERDTAMQDIHGIAEAVTETPELVTHALEQLEKCLAELPIPQKEAYDRAMYLSPDYVRDSSFRLKFLRGALLDAPQAACRMVRHFEEKLKLFGIELLAKDIQMSDLNDLDRETLKLGTVQWLPVRDRAGRAVFCMPATKMNLKETRTRNRLLWYTAMTALADEETQKNGAVVVVLNVGPHRLSLDHMFYIRESKRIVAEAMPHRVTSLHYCYDDYFVYPFVTLFRFILGDRIALGSFRLHFGTPSEYSYALLTYGIPAQFLPMNEAGEVLLEHHLEWIERRRAQESSGLRATAMIPRRFDVLLGRGGDLSDHTGNLRAFHIVEMNRERYEKAGKFEKTQIAERIVHLIHQSYGRFLGKENGEWVEVTTETAREKISHCFRRLRELDRKRNPPATTTATKRPGRESTGTASVSPIIDDQGTGATVASSDGTKRVKS